jgi:hypothetical protein
MTWIVISSGSDGAGSDVGSRLGRHGAGTADTCAGRGSWSGSGSRKLPAHKLPRLPYRGCALVGCLNCERKIKDNSTEDKVRRPNCSLGRLHDGCLVIEE